MRNAAIGAGRAGSLRLRHLDALLALATLLPLWSHAFGSVDLRAVYPPRLLEALHLAFWTTTPLLAVAFGIVFELLLVPALAGGRVGFVRRHLLRLALALYAAYLAIAVTGALGGHRGWRETLAAAALLGEARYGNMLKLFFLEAMLALPLLRVRVRFGLPGVGLAALACWLAVPLLAQVSWPPAGEPLAHLTALLVGRPPVESAVSLLHGQVLFVAGMFVGRVLGAPDADRRLPRLLGAAIVFGALTVAAWALADGPQQVYRGYLSREFRSANHVLYFAVSGTCAAAMMLGLCALARPSARGGFRRWPLRVPSHHPILVYALGHVVLNLCPPELRLPPLAATVAWIAFPLAVAAAIALPQHMARGRDD